MDIENNIAYSIGYKEGLETCENRKEQ